MLISILQASKHTHTHIHTHTHRQTHPCASCKHASVRILQASGVLGARAMEKMQSWVERSRAKARRIFEQFSQAPVLAFCARSYVYACNACFCAVLESFCAVTMQEEGRETATGLEWTPRAYESVERKRTCWRQTCILSRHRSRRSSLSAISCGRHSTSARGTSPKLEHVTSLRRTRHVPSQNTSRPFAGRCANEGERRASPRQARTRHPLPQPPRMLAA